MRGRFSYDRDEIISVVIIVMSVLIFGFVVVRYIVTEPEDDTLGEEIMPEIVGYSMSDVEACYGRFFTLNIVEERYSEYANGVILSQSIKSGEVYTVGNTVVDIVLSAGTEPVETTVAVTIVVTEPEIVLETGLFVDNVSMEFETLSSGDDPYKVTSVGIDTENEEMAAALDRLYRVLVKRGGDAGFLYVDLESGASVEYNADEKFSAVSVVKAPYVRAVLGQESDLTRYFKMTEEMLNSSAELINNQTIGTMFTTEELAEAAFPKVIILPIKCLMAN